MCGTFAAGCLRPRRRSAGMLRKWSDGVAMKSRSWLCNWKATRFARKHNGYVAPRCSGMAHDDNSVCGGPLQVDRSWLLYGAREAPLLVDGVVLLEVFDPLGGNHQA